jgi:hypothetical protein
VPVLSKEKYKQSILETKINNAIQWKRKHLKAILWNYRNAPYIKKYEFCFWEIYSKEWNLLCELNIELIKKILEILGIKRNLYRSSELNLTGRRTELIVEMCKKLSADTYLSGIHGRDYLDERLFVKNSVKLIYQDFRHPSYKQCWGGEFIPNLSIIDLLLNCGENSLEILMGHR